MKTASSITNELLGEIVIDAVEPRIKSTKELNHDFKNNIMLLIHHLDQASQKFDRLSPTKQDEVIETFKVCLSFIRVTTKSIKRSLG